jgi:small subunit ribosomal protein S6
MAKPYEMVVLYHPDLEIDLDKALKKVENIVTSNKGKIIKTDNWGKRKLAYTIKNEDHAIYVYYDVELESDSAGKIETTLNITDEVLRYLIVKPGPELEDESSDDKDVKEDTKVEKVEKPAAKKTVKKSEKPKKEAKAKKTDKDVKEDEE